MSQQLIKKYQQTDQYKMMIINFDPNFDQMKVKHLATRNLNPGNLRSFITGRFRKFDNLKEGYLALIADIKWKQSGNSSVIDSNASLWEFIHVYAPAFDNNNPARYAYDVAHALNTDLNTSINQINAYDLAKWIIKSEDRQLFELMFEDQVFIKHQKIRCTNAIRLIVFNTINQNINVLKKQINSNKVLSINYMSNILIQNLQHEPQQSLSRN